MRLLPAACLLVSIASAQEFSGLAPDYTGSRLWFSSALRLKGTNQQPHSKLFLWDQSSGLQLFYEKEATISSLFPIYMSTSTYRLRALAITADGSVISVVGAADCSGLGACTQSAELYDSELWDNSGRRIMNVVGSTCLSPNGRYAFASSSRTPPIPWPASMVDLVTGTRTELSNYLQSGVRHCVANNGSVVLRPLTSSPGPLVRMYSGVEIPLSIPNPLDSRNAMISADGSRVIVRQEAGLVAIDIFSGNVTQLASAVDSPRISLARVAWAHSVDMADDASLIAFIDHGAVFTVRWDGSGLTRVADNQDPVIEIALSGNGRVLFAVTQSSRVFRVDLVRAETTTVVPSTPSLQVSASGNEMVAPGSSYKWSGTGLDAVGGMRVGTQPVQVLSTEPTSITFQIPWDAQYLTGWVQLSAKEQKDGPFEVAASIGRMRISEFEPQLISGPWHQNFHGLVTPSDPLGSGEVVHFFASGLGSVTPRVETGKAAPSPPAGLVQPFQCGFWNGGNFNRVQVVFAGLAPGWIGLYQLDMRLPFPMPGNPIGTPNAPTFVCFPAPYW